LLVGAYAVSHHGHPRATADIDVWVRRTPENAQRVVAALRDFGFASLKLDTATFEAPDQVVQLGHPPIRIDVLTSVSGVEFERCWPSRVQTTIDGIAVNIIGLADLRTNKLAAGRHKDLDDLEHLE
jgi:hypothetical protein